MLQLVAVDFLFFTSGQGESPAGQVDWVKLKADVAGRAWDAEETVSSPIAIILSKSNGRFIVSQQE